MRRPNEKLSLYILKLTGWGLLFATVSILSPTLPYAILKQSIKRKFGKTYNSDQIGNSVRYLKRKKFIAFERKNKKTGWSLTRLGKKHLSQRTLSEISITPTRWDGYWRLLSFDIPESHKPARQAFGRKLMELGFFHFQRSVFILPYECQKEIDMITTTLEIRSFVHLIKTFRFNSDEELLKKFKLG